MLPFIIDMNWETLMGGEIFVDEDPNVDGVVWVGMLVWGEAPLVELNPWIQRWVVWFSILVICILFDFNVVLWFQRGKQQGVHIVMEYKSHSEGTVIWMEATFG